MTVFALVIMVWLLKTPLIAVWKGSTPKQERKVISLDSRNNPTEQKRYANLKLIFKNSPALTEQRKERIRNDIGMARDYLLNLDIEAPLAVPPISVMRGGLWGGCGGTIGKMDSPLSL
jgi:hypothetical protein